MSSDNVWKTCTLDTCPIERSVFRYRPTLPGSATLIALFSLSLLLHLFQAVRYRQRTFGLLMAAGCVCEIVGYAGRIMMYYNPFDFGAFLMQIICIGTAPVFMTAAIYVTLYKSIMTLSPSAARVRPSLYFLFFIPCDIISLVLQAAGGALSTQSNGSSKVGVKLGLAGLSFQVITLFFFICLAIDYAIQYRKVVPKGQRPLSRAFKQFLFFISLAMILIFIRCVYRIYELSDGYGGVAIHDEPLFIGLESCMIIVATWFLNFGHPGRAYKYEPAHGEEKLSPVVRS